MNIPFRFLLLVSVFQSFSLSAFSQGSLTPPGPPAPTFKTLQQVEPRVDLQNAPASAVTTSDANYHFIITQPGSYYLTANIVATKSNAVQILAEGVTLDLNGFEISHQAARGGNGIELSGSAHRATVENGSITNFTAGTAVAAVNNVTPRNCAYRKLAVRNCLIGLGVAAESIVEGCRLLENSSDGLSANGACIITKCVASFNGSAGIKVAASSQVRDCEVIGNAEGIVTGSDCIVAHCTAKSNNGSGSTSAGIRTGIGCSVTHCVSNNNLSTNATLTGATGAGFDIGGSSTIENCVARENIGDGIRVNADTVVRQNNCVVNGAGGDGAGIHATSSDNRIESNNVTDNDRGIDVDAAGNVILKNSASGNTTNYEIAANNVFGQIVDRTAPSSAAVSGNSAASAAATTDPWANISY
jgi:parallel beta-helix repeat protein